MKKQTLIVGRKPDHENAVIIEDGHLSTEEAEQALRRYLYSDTDYSQAHRKEVIEVCGFDLYLDILVQGYDLDLIGHWD